MNENAMLLKYTEEDFDKMSWHDNYIYGIHLSVGDITLGDWRSGLVLDIDHIVEWLCGIDGKVRFKVSPATLTFHHVTDLKINVDWGDSGFQIALNEISISHIGRERIKEQKICFDRPYYSWVIETNLPQGGKISFGASGFTQVLREEPILTGEQKLSTAKRAKM